MIPFVIIIMLISSNIGYGIAKIKGEDPIRWAFICGFFPFAIIILLIIKDKRKCPNCEEFINLNAKVCKFCNNKLNPLDNYKIEIKSDDSWEKLKNDIINQYKPLGYDIIKNKDSYFEMKNKSFYTYIKLKNKGKVKLIEAEMVEEPNIYKEITNSSNSFINTDKNEEKQNNSNNILELIELSKLLEKGLITKEEFNYQKDKLLNLAN